MHFAMITLGAAGHVFSSLPMIAELVKKGNRVTYFTVPRYKAMVEDIPTTEKSVRPTKDGQADRDITDMMAELPLRFPSRCATIVHHGSSASEARCRDCDACHAAVWLPRSRRFPDHAVYQLRFQ